MARFAHQVANTTAPPPHCLKPRNGVSRPQRGDAAETRKASAFGKCNTSSSRSSYPNQYAIADSRFAVGTVREIEGVFTAIDIDGVIVGEFATLREAAAALPANGGAS
jgi:hypothetical protein